MNNMFDPNTLKNLQQMMNGLTNFTQQPAIDLKTIKKLILIVVLSLFLSGFGVGLLIGLLF
jgi:hypothetical protein